MTFVRSKHPYQFKSGEWAEIIGTSVVNDRHCWDVLFADGSVDTWVVDDPVADYEFRDLDPREGS